MMNVKTSSYFPSIDENAFSNATRLVGRKTTKAAKKDTYYASLTSMERMLSTSGHLLSCLALLLVMAGIETNPGPFTTDMQDIERLALGN